MNRILTLILFILPTLVSAQYQWTQKASMSVDRYAATGFSIGNKGYVCSGYNQANITMNDLWEWNQATNVWTQKASMSGSRFSAASFVIGNYAYVGLGLSSGQFKTDLQRYDPATNTWASRASLPSTGRYGSASFMINDKGYVVNGNMGSANGPYSDQLWEYDPDLDTWTARASMPGITRYGTRGFSLDGNGYITCGVHYASSTFLNDVWMYNPVTNSWSQRASFPGAPRDYPITFNFDNGAVVGTGNSFSGQFSDFYIYTSTTNSWSPIVSLPSSPRWAAVGFSIGNFGYLASGQLNNGINTMELWELSNPLGVFEGIVPTEIKIFPNPAKDFINLIIENDKIKFTSYEIVSSSGKMILHGNFSVDEQIFIGNFTDGIYLINLYSDQAKVGIGKIIVRK
jgi:N-acetylneuraminic acid mutarotase